MKNSNSIAILALSLISLAACSTKAVAPPKAAGMSVVKAHFAKGAVTAQCNDAIKTTRAKLDAIAAIPQDKRTLDNTLLAFESVTADFSDLTLPLTFMGYVSMDEGTHAEGSACEEKVNEFGVEIITRKDLYLAVQAKAPRNDAEKRLLSETLKGFEQNGLKLPDDKLAQVKDLKQKLSVLESKFATNLNNDTSTVELTEEEIAGAPTDYRAGLKKTADGKHCILNARESDYTVFLPNASNSEGRRKWLAAYYSRGGAPNTELLEQAIGLRQQIAALMGYSVWGDYRIHGRMAKDSKTVLDFLHGLEGKLAKRNREDMQKLLKFKKELDPKATKVENWDINYLAYQLKKRDFKLDEEKIREYFPANLVIDGIFKVYSQLLGVDYKEVKDAEVWSPDVKLYQIINHSDQKLIGYFYTDFNPRPKKYGHAAAFPLIMGRMLPNGYSQPVSAIVANLNPPANGKPSLLSHDDVVTVFHEFGHIMHQTLTRGPYASISGSAVAQDFVEAPSQMLENWPWDRSILKMLSGHYLDNAKKLPEELLKQMVRARDFNQGYKYTRQLVFALTDMTYSTTPGKIDTTETYNKIFTRMVGVDAMPNTRFPATFGHLMGGYDAGYYGYLWSEVYAEDMFTRFKHNLLNPKVGAQYRKIILEMGDMKEALDLLTQFLGRKPNTAAFLKKLHIR